MVYNYLSLVWLIMTTVKLSLEPGHIKDTNQHGHRGGCSLLSKLCSIIRASGQHFHLQYHPAAMLVNVRLTYCNIWMASYEKLLTRGRDGPGVKF